MRLSFLILLTSFLGITIHNCVAQDTKTPKTVLIIVDGIPADLLERLPTPNIDAISREGGYTRAYTGGERGGYSETPTISAVGYNSMLTGTWSNKHNVWGNGIEDPNYHYWTIFRLLKESQPSSKLAIYSTWLDNRTKLLGADLPQTGNLQLDYCYDGYELDTLRFPHDDNSRYINLIDEEVAKQASQSIRQDAPDLSWVYLQYTDDMGHRYGESEEMIRAVKIADRQIGDIYNSIKYREQYFNEDWLLVVTTDHGRDIVNGSGHGGQTDAERCIWIATNYPDLNKHFYVHTPAMVDILPSVANHMEIPLADVQRYELDGVPFIGKVSLADPQVQLKGDTLELEWTPFTNEGMVNVLVTATNQFNKQGVDHPDTYQPVGEYKISARKATIKLPKDLASSKFLKVVIEGEHNAVNRWIVRQ